MPNANDKFIQLFKKLATYYETQGDYRAIIYKKTINALSKLPEIRDKTDIDKLKGVKDIGPATITKIQEILDTGTLAILEELSMPEKEKIDVIKELCTIRSIGPKTAEKMYEKGIKSIKDLLTYPDLTDAQKLGLKYHIDLQKRIPRNDITIFHEYIKSIVPESWKTDIAGSYRRGLETCGDIDLLISTDTDEGINIRPLIAKLQKDNLLVGIYGISDKFMSGLILLNGTVRSLDIKSYTDEEKPFALLYFTGPGSFNVSMRNNAIRQGYKLSDTSLIDLSSMAKIKCKTEKSIFKKLNLDYLEPEKRV